MSAGRIKPKRVEMLFVRSACCVSGAATSHGIRRHFRPAVEPKIHRSNFQSWKTAFNKLLSSPASRKPRSTADCVRLQRVARRTTYIDRCVHDALHQLHQQAHNHSSKKNSCRSTRGNRSWRWRWPKMDRDETQTRINWLADEEFAKISAKKKEKKGKIIMRKLEF